MKVIPVLSATVAAAVALIAAATPARAATVPFTEQFETDVAGWANSAGDGLLMYVVTGGPDDDSYASTQLVPAGSGDSSVVLFRAQDEFNSSGNALAGNWIAEGVGQLTAYVRHNGSQPLTFFTRFAGPANYPGGVAVAFVPVPPNTWTPLSFDISPANPAFVSFEGTDFGSVFANVGHVQIGVSVPAALDEFTSPLTFDLDRPTILPVPEPGGAALAGSALAGLLVWCRPRRR